MIWKYEQRRESIRRKYGIKSSKSPTVTYEYRRAIFKINDKLKVWRRAIRRIDAATEKLKGISKIEKAVINLVNVRFKGINGQHLPENVTLAKGIFYKYGLENGFKGASLVEYIGGSHKEQARDYRKRLTKSFKTNDKNRTTFYQLKAYLENKAI